MRDNGTGRREVARKTALATCGQLDHTLLQIEVNMAIWCASFIEQLDSGNRKRYCSMLILYCASCPFASSESRTHVNLENETKSDSYNVIVEL